MTDSDAQLPEFPITLRGYDRDQVDAYIRRLLGRLEDALDSEPDPEPEPPADWHAHIGPRVAQIFDLAEAEAEDMRASAEHQADLLLADTRRAAEQILDAAGAEGREISAQGHAEFEAKQAEFVRERDRIRREVQQLEQRRSDVLEELRRLHSALGMAPGMAAVATDADTDPLESGQGRGHVKSRPSEAADTRGFDPVEPLRLLPADQGDAREAPGADSQPPREERRHPAQTEEWALAEEDAEWESEDEEWGPPPEEE